MLKSMTGFGRGEYEDEQFSVTIEMKTVNHRYNEVAIRLPRRPPDNVAPPSPITVP